VGFELVDEGLCGAGDCVVSLFCCDVEVVAVFVDVLGFVGLDVFVGDCLCEYEAVFFEGCFGEFVSDFE